MEETSTSTLPEKKWVKLTKILLQNYSRGELKTAVDDARDEIHHQINEDGDIIKKEMTSIDAEYGETLKTLTHKNNTTASKTEV